MNCYEDVVTWRQPTTTDVAEVLGKALGDYSLFVLEIIRLAVVAPFFPNNETERTTYIGTTATIECVVSGNSGNGTSHWQYIAKREVRLKSTT